MKHLKMLAFAAIAISIAACNDKTPTEPDYDVTTEMNLVSSQYYGDDEEDGIAKFTVAISVNYDKKAITRANGESSAKDVFHLTFFSPTVIDAEYALPEDGTYTIGSAKALSVVLEGKSASDNKYEGSYVVSTAGGVSQESKITGGSMAISYVNGKCVYKLDFEDEKGILNKYADIGIEYASDGQFFSNEAIVYSVFNKPGDEYNRCWYWGEPLSSGRNSADGTPLGEYQFVFSNAASGEIVSANQVLTTFSLMDEYQVYGLDRKINPGVYHVNQDGYKGKLGTIYKTNLTDVNAAYSGTVRVKVFESGKAVYKYVTDGWMAIFGSDNSTPDRFVINFTLEDGSKFHGRYDGELPIGDECTYSNFREDITLNNLSSAYMRIKDPEWRYQQAGTNQWELYLMGPGVSISFDEYGSEIIHGPGDCFRFAISTAASATSALPAGTYNIEDSYAAGIAQQGNKSIAYIGIYMGAFFHRIPVTGDHLHAVILDGSLAISQTEGIYTIEATLHDDAKNTHTAKFTGVPTIEDHRTPPAGKKSGGERLSKAISKYSPDSSAYGLRQKERIEAAAAMLK